MILVPRHPESESSTTSPSVNDDSNDPAITIGIVFAITVGIGLILLCVGCFFYRRGKKSAATVGEDDNVQLQTDHQVGDDSQTPGAPTNELWWQNRSWTTELEGYEHPVEVPATPLIERRLSELDIFPQPSRTMTRATEDRPGRKDSQGSAVILVGENQGQKKYSKRWLGGGWPSFSH